VLIRDAAAYWMPRLKRGMTIEIYPDSTIVRKTACHGAILGFVIGA
jgi:hypothetical protein